MASLVSLILVLVGTLMIALGTYMTHRDWDRRQFGQRPEAERHALGSTLTALTKLLEALKGYPTGQRLIVFGIVVVIIGGLFGGVSGLVDAAPAEKGS